MKLKCKFVINTIAGDRIAVPVGSNSPLKGYIKLNSTGKDVFEMLSKDTSRDEIIAQMQKKYPDTDPEDISSSVDAMIEKLASADLLI